MVLIVREKMSRVEIVEVKGEENTADWCRITTHNPSIGLYLLSRKAPTNSPERRARITCLVHKAT